MALLSEGEGLRVRVLCILRALLAALNGLSHVDDSGLLICFGVSAT